MTRETTRHGHWRLTESDGHGLRQVEPGVYELDAAPLVVAEYLWDHSSTSHAFARTTVGNDSIWKPDLQHADWGSVDHAQKYVHPDYAVYDDGTDAPGSEGSGDLDLPIFVPEANHVYRATVYGQMFKGGSHGDTNLVRQQAFVGMNIEPAWDTWGDFNGLFPYSYHPMSSFVDVTAVGYAGLPVRYDIVSDCVIRVPDHWPDGAIVYPSWAVQLTKSGGADPTSITFAAPSMHYVLVDLGEIRSRLV